MEVTLLPEMMGCQHVFCYVYIMEWMGLSWKYYNKLSMRVHSLMITEPCWRNLTEAKHLPFKPWTSYNDTKAVEPIGEKLLHMNTEISTQLHVYSTFSSEQLQNQSTDIEELKLAEIPWCPYSAYLATDIGALQMKKDPFNLVNCRSSREVGQLYSFILAPRRAT